MLLVRNVITFLHYYHYYRNFIFLTVFDSSNELKIHDKMVEEINTKDVIGIEMIRNFQIL